MSLVWISLQILGQQGGVVVTRTIISAKLDAFGTLPGPVGAGLAPDDGPVGILTKTITSWLVT